MVWFIGNPYAKKTKRFGNYTEYQDVTGTSNINLSVGEIQKRKRKRGGDQPWDVERTFPVREKYTTPWFQPFD